MTMRSATLAVMLVGALSLAPVVGSAQESEAPPVSTAPAEPVRHLGLGNLAGPWPGEFVLFSERWSPLTFDPLLWPPTPWGGAQGPRPHLVGLRSFGLSVRIGEELGPDGKRRLVFAPLYRDWDDLSGWEKFGVALQYAGAAAAIGTFVEKLVH